MQAAIALRLQRLEEETERLRPVAEADRARTVLLNEAGHDLRVPLTAAATAVEELAGAGATGPTAGTDAERAALIRTARISLRRLDRLVGSLLDVSRVQAGTLGVDAQPLAVEDIVSGVLDGLAPSCHHVDLRIPDSVPEALADPKILERILVNVIAHVQHVSPREENVLLTASAHAGRVELRVVGHGAARRDAGDSGITLARALAHAMGATLQPEETPGGGLTMTLGLPVALPPAASLDESDQTAHPAVVDRVTDWRARNG